MDRWDTYMYISLLVIALGVARIITDTKTTFLYMGIITAVAGGILFAYSLWNKLKARKGE